MNDILADFRAIKNPYLRLLFLCMASTISFLVIMYKSADISKEKVLSEQIVGLKREKIILQLEKNGLVRLLIIHDSTCSEEKILLMKEVTDRQEKRIVKQDSLLMLKK